MYTVAQYNVCRLQQVVTECYAMMESWLHMLADVSMSDDTP